MTRPKRTRERGFTLVELMISLVLFSLVAAGLLSVAVTMASGYREQQLTIATESSVRGAVDYMTEAMRGVSPGVPVANIQHVNTCATGALTLTNQSTGPDQLTAVFASGAVVTSTRAVYGSGTTTLAVTDARQLAAGDTVLITNLDQGHLATIVSSTTGSITLAPQSCGSLALPAGGYGAGSLVVRASRSTFFVGSLDGLPTLMIDPDAEGPAVAEPFAEGVEDLQIAIGVDADGDGALTEVGLAAGDDEWTHNRAGETQPAGTIRAIRVTLISRATGKRVNATGQARPAAEDRAAATEPDGYRRRALTTTIEIRNFGGSP